MAVPAAAIVVTLRKIRHAGSGVVAVLGTVTLIYMTMQQYNDHGLRPQELWLFGLLVAVTFEAIASFFRPAAVSTQISIWSLTLMGCSCLVGGFTLRHGFIATLGGAMIIGSFIMAVMLPHAVVSDQVPAKRL